MNIFSLAHINELALRLPDPAKATERVLRLPLVPFGVFLAPASAVMLIWGDRLLGRVFFTP